MLERLLDPIFAPFRALRSMVWGIKQAPNALKGEVNRARNEAALVKSDLKGYRAAAGPASGAVKGAAAKAAKPEVPRKKMSLFGKKSVCESCGQKLHKSWDECPYCGWKRGSAPGGAAQSGVSSSRPGPAAGGSPPRTMALDMSGGAALPGMGILAWFIPMEGVRSGELIELRGRVTIGKSSDNSVVFDDPSISGHHCEFMGSPMGWKLNDLGSTNGTFVNDKRITSHDLIDNDNVKLGKVRFKFKSLN